jgi:hypothetical protein
VEVTTEKPIMEQDGGASERVADLELALDLALRHLIRFEPGDSRAVSDEFVAMAAIQCGLFDRLGECRDIIRAAIERDEERVLP